MGMSKRNSEYWKKRMEILQNAQMNKGERYLIDLDRQYNVMSKNIEKELAAWYQRLADNNGITLIEAKKLLKANELKEFKWTVEEYINFGEENALNQRWMKELENASARVHISRLKALEIQLQQQIEILYGRNINGLSDLLREIYTEGHYRTAYELQKGFNVGWNLKAIDNNVLDKIISRPWTTDSRTFSNRLWSYKQVLINELQTHLTQAFIAGKSPDAAISLIAKRLETDKGKAGRLVMNESAAFAAIARKDTFNSLDVEMYEVVVTLDTHTSKTCREADSWEPIPMKDYEIGKTAPPLHVNCRSTIAPYFEDDSDSQRIARGADGKTFYVSSRMKYPEWKKTYVDNPINKFKGIYERWDGNSVKEFASSIVKSENLPLRVQRHQISANGQCQLSYSNPKMEIATFEINSGDKRSIEYQIKTVFHELFHAKSHGVTHDIGEISFKDWAYIDDVFAESTAHYINRLIGIEKEITPSYPGYLVETLPKLKKLPEFKECGTIAGFGEVAYNYRFSNNLNAKWKNLHAKLRTIDYDMIEYSKNYIDYISENKNELVDQLLENMPKYKSYKPNMIENIEEAIQSINAGHSLSGNPKMIFENALIITMNRLGVK